jgi:hypothetical protein
MSFTTGAILFFALQMIVLLGTYVANAIREKEPHMHSPRYRSDTTKSPTGEEEVTLVCGCGKKCTVRRNHGETIQSDWIGRVW